MERVRKWYEKYLPSDDKTKKVPQFLIPEGIWMVDVKKASQYSALRSQKKIAKKYS